MSITVIQYIRNELLKTFPEATVSNEDITRSLIAGNMLSTGKMTLKDLIPTAKKHAELLYAAAYEFYQKNQIEKAYRLFAVLCAYDPKCVKFLEGWGVTCKLLKKHNEALIAYYTISNVDPLNIVCFLDMAEEFFKIKQPDTAIKCCEAVERMAKEEPWQSEHKKDLDAYVKKVAALRKAFTSKK